ncbi:MAG: hypothetical protein Nk1A_8510 [Endomicrobiia bacterium]|nr:MAG: hypothetical protein Nk1A_8510 [Endomicrobiia bacterium]
MTDDNFLDTYVGGSEYDDSDDFSLAEPGSLFGDGATESPSGITEPTEPKGPVDNPQTDPLVELLKEKGILDPTQIKFENEDGEEEKISFYDLPVEDQLEILRTQPESDNTDLDEVEVNLINFLRENQLTPEELLEHTKKTAIEEYLANQQPLEPIESMSDDEIYLLDLLSRVEDITDDEAREELELAKQNEAIYQKKVDALRQDLL